MTTIKVRTVDNSLFSVQVGGNTGIETYAQLKNALEAEGCDVGDYVLYNIRDQELQDNDPIDEQQTTLKLKPPPYNIEVIHLGESVNVRLPLDHTVADVKRLYEDATGTRIPALSYEGELLHDHEILSARKLHDGSSVVGSMRLIVHDIECDLQKAVEVMDTDFIRTVKQSYAAQTKRILLERATLTLATDPPELLVDDQRVHEANLRDGQTLHLTQPPFEIYVRDRDGDNKMGPVIVTVRDHYKVGQVKEEINKVFSTQGTDLLVVADRLIFKGEELDDTSEIYKHSITEKSIVEIQREDITQQHSLYICADCGSDVKLKKTDMVRCRECGYRIVYKKRTMKPCQYLCR